MKHIYPRAINHIGISVPDVEAAVKWYREVMGFQLIGDKIHLRKRSDDPDGRAFIIYGPELNEMRIAMMATGNGVGFEIFQFVDPPFKKPEKDFEYNLGGFFHFCVTDVNPYALGAKMVEQGGSRVGGVSMWVEGMPVAYAKDPWGNVIEILNVSFDRLASKMT